MPCNSCQSENTRTFNAEVGIHFPGLKGLEMPLVFVFPKLKVCLDCGGVEFEIPERELLLLTKAEIEAASDLNQR